MMKYLKNIHIRSIYKTLVITIALCFLYNIAYLTMSFMSLNSFLSNGIQVALSLVSSVVFYMICGSLWKLKDHTFNSILKVLLLQMGYIVIISLLNPLATHFQDQTVIQIIIQLIAAICLVTMVPIQIIFYYGILSKQANLAEFMWSVIKKHQKSILNWFCVLMIFILFVDTMTGGLFSISSGFNAVNILTSMLYMGNPMMSWMVLFYLGMGFQVSLSVLFANVFLSFLAGFIYTILELNFILYVGRKCDEA